MTNQEDSKPDWRQRLRQPGLNLPSDSSLLPFVSFGDVPGGPSLSTGLMDALAAYTGVNLASQYFGTGEQPPGEPSPYSREIPGGRFRPQGISPRAGGPEGTSFFQLPLRAADPFPTFDRGGFMGAAALGGPSFMGEQVELLDHIEDLQDRLDRLFTESQPLSDKSESGKFSGREQANLNSYLQEMGGIRNRIEAAMGLLEYGRGRAEDARIEKARLTENALDRKITQGGLDLDIEEAAQGAREFEQTAAQGALQYEETAARQRRQYGKTAAATVERDRLDREAEQRASLLRLLPGLITARQQQEQYTRTAAVTERNRQQSLAQDVATRQQAADLIPQLFPDLEIDESVLSGGINPALIPVLIQLAQFRFAQKQAGVSQGAARPVTAFR
jgi:hypothetical protein